MLPLDEIHHIGEGTHHAVTTCGNFFRFFVHQVVGVMVISTLFREFLLLLAEGVSIPAHNEPRFKGECFELPKIRYSVAVYTDSAFRIGLSAFRIIFILPEASAKDGRISRVHGPDADASQLAVSTAYNDRGSCGKAGFRCGTFRDITCLSTAFLYRRENVIS